MKGQVPVWHRKLMGMGYSKVMPSKVAGRSGLGQLPNRKSENFPFSHSPQFRDPPKISLDQPIDIALTLAMADLKAHFIDVEKGVVHYRRIGALKSLSDIKILQKDCNRLIFTPFGDGIKSSPFGLIFTIPL